MNPFLSEKTRIELKKAHKKEPHRRHANRIKAILLIDSGWSYEEVAETLLLDDQTIRNYEKLYKDKGFDGLLSDNYVGCVPKLTCEQEEQLKDHIREKNYSAAKEIVEYIKQTFNIIYTPEGKEIPSNAGKKRMNLNGAIDIGTFEVTIREDESINAQSTIKLFKEIESRYAQASTIYIVSNNAPYYRSKLVKEYLENSRIKIEFLPSYAPNLNLIERLWKFFRKKILYNKYYDTYEKFKNKCLSFFKNINEYTDELLTLLTENFQIIGEQISKT